MEAIQGYLHKIGIDTKLNWFGADVGTLVKLRNAGKVKYMGMYTWGTPIWDADGILPYWLNYGEPKNYNNDKEMGDWIVAAGRTLDKNKRLELYRKIQRRVIERAYWFPVFSEVSLYGIHKDLNFVTLGEFPLYFKCSWKK